MTKTHHRKATADETTGHGKVRESYDTAVDAAQHAFERSRDAALRTATSLESSPLALVVGGIAVGAVAAALIPRSDREKELLAPLGKRLGAAAGAALATAKESGRAELANIGISRDAARDRAQGLFGGLGKALSEAGSAAIDAAREPVKD